MTRLLPHAVGLTWVTDDAIQKGSHALVDDGRVWLVDPVDDEAALAQVAALGTPQAVVQLLDRHGRDCAAIAQRLGVPHLGVGDEPTDAPFVAHPVIGRSRWRERALWWAANRTLVVAEAVGTAPAFAVGRGPLGVHPLLRLTPPAALRPFAPEHLLVGHGAPVHGPETPAHLAEALDRSRRDLPRLVLALPAMIRDARR